MITVGVGDRHGNEGTEGTTRANTVDISYRVQRGQEESGSQVVLPKGAGASAKL